MSTADSRDALNRMDAIKKKMLSLAAETEAAEARAKKFEDEAQSATILADKNEETVMLQWLLLFYFVLLHNVFSAVTKQNVL